MKLKMMSKVLAVLVQLAICQFAFDAFISPAQAEHSVRRHLNYSESSFDRLNNAIYNQLLNAELSPAAQRANELKSGEPEAFDRAQTKDEQNSKIGQELAGGTIEPTQQINYQNELADLNDELDEESDQQRLHKNRKLSTKSAGRIDGHSQVSSADSRRHSSNKQPATSLYSILHTVAHSTLDYQSPSTLQSNSDPLSSDSNNNPDNRNPDSNRTLLDLLDVQFISKQFERIGDQDSSVHWLIEANNSSPPNSSTAGVADHPDRLKVGTVFADLSINRTDQPLARNQMSTGSGKSRSARSSNNPKLTELVRRQNCVANKDCIHSNVCDFSQGLCKCPRNYINVNDMKDQKEIEPVNWPPTHCYAAQQLEKSCIYDEQCIVKHSKCTRDESLGSQLICACTLGYASKGRSPFVLFRCAFHVWKCVEILNFGELCSISR